MAKMKIGFVGTGYMGQNAHLRNYIALSDDCEVVAVSEPRTQTGQLVATRYGIKNVYKNHIEMLENEKLDGVVAAQNFRHHAELVPDILKYKVNLLTEKPLCLSVENGELLAKVAKENGVSHMVGYHKRSDPAMEYAVDLIAKWKASGEFGKMRYARITMPPGDWINGADKTLAVDGEEVAPFVPEGMPAQFVGEWSDEYWKFINYYIHQVNAMRFLLGEDYDLKYVEKSQAILAVESKSGVAGILEMATYSTEDDWQEKMFVSFERGYIEVALPAPLAMQQAGKVTVMENKKGCQQITYSPTMPNVSAMRNQALNYIKMLRGEKKAPCYSDEAVLDLKIAIKYIEMLMGK